MSIGYGQSFDPVYGYICIICTYVYMYVYSCFIDMYIVYEVLCRHSSVYPLSIYMKTVIHRYCHQLLMSAIWRRWVRTNDYTLSSVICHGIYMFSVQVQVQILYKSSSTCMLFSRFIHCFSFLPLSICWKVCCF